MPVGEAVTMAPINHRHYRLGRTTQAQVKGYIISLPCGYKPRFREKTKQPIGMLTANPIRCLQLLGCTEESK
jgi:hypothetical protein